MYVLGVYLSHRITFSYIARVRYIYTIIDECSHSILSPQSCNNGVYNTLKRCKQKHRIKMTQFVLNVI